MKTRGEARIHDALVVGGGPAGLAAAFWLARYRRRVRVVDAERPRNARTWAVHGYPGLVGVTPAELRRHLREQAVAAGAEYAAGQVIGLEGGKDAFRVNFDNAPPLVARRVLIACGRQDTVPQIPGLAELFGSSVFHCPDCDGPALAGARLGVLGWDREAAGVALLLLTWTEHVTFFAHEHAAELDLDCGRALQRCGVAIVPQRVARLEAEDDRLAAVVLEDGSAVPVAGLFVHTGSAPASDLAERAGCRQDRHGHVWTDAAQESSVPGLYSAGDAAGHPYLAVMAAAQGVRAALAMHRSLLPAKCHF